MSSDLDALLTRVNGASAKLRVAMGVTAALCVLIAVGVVSDPSVWNSGWGWRVGGLAGTIFFVGIAVLLLYGTFLRQRRHITRLRLLLHDDPERIRSIERRVARAVPSASWVPDDGSATRGLHILVTDDAGTVWVLPVSRTDIDAIVNALARQCPNAVMRPEQ